MFVYLNNRLVPEEEAVVSVYDHGFLYGDGIYETVRVYEGVVFMFDEHLRRLDRSASLVSMKLPLTETAIRGAVMETLRANDLADASVRISLTRGAGPLGLDPDLCERPTFVIYAHPFTNYPAELYEQGVRVMIARTRRNHREALNPQIKSHNFLNNILAKIESKEGGYFEAILRNIEGHLAEGTVTNVFFVKHGILCTPDIEVGLLDGITRSLLLRLALEIGMKVREGRFRPGDIKNADEVFISNSLMEVMPVVYVGTEMIAAGKVGHWTERLLEAYRQAVREHIDAVKKSSE